MIQQRIDNFNEVAQTLPEEEAHLCLSCCRLCYNPNLEKDVT